MSDSKTNHSKINNRVEAIYSFSPDKNQSDIIVKESTKSNVVKVNIAKTDEPSVDIRKFSVKNAVEINGINSYIIIVINSGNTNLYSLKLRDRIDDNTIYISNSASIKDHSNIENYPNTTLLEYANTTEAAEDTYFTDSTREKQAIDVREGTLSTIDAIKGIAGIPVPAGYDSWDKVIEAIDVKFGTQATDSFDIQKINDGYRLYEDGTYGDISKAVRATFDVVSNMTQENIISPSKYPLTNMILKNVLSWLNEETTARDNRTAIADSIRVIQKVFNKLVDESFNEEFPQNKRSCIRYEITKLKSILETSFMTYILDSSGAGIINSDDLYYTENDNTKVKTKVKEVYVQDSDIPDGAAQYLKVGNVPDDASSIELLIEKVSSLYDLINGFVPEAINLEVDKIWFNVKDRMNALLVYTNSLAQIPKYQIIDGITDYNNQIKSRIGKLSDAVKDIVAIVYNVLPFLFDEANNQYYDQYYEYVNDLKRIKSILASSLLSLADSTDIKAIDNVCSAFFYGNIVLKRIRDDLGEQYPALYKEIENSEVVPFKFRPCTSEPDLMNPNIPMNPNNPGSTGKNPDSPEYDWTNPDAPKRQLLTNVVIAANEIIRELTSYVIVYEDSKKPDYVKQNNSPYRDLIYNINMVLLENEVVTLTMVTKVLGDEEVIVEGTGTDVGKRYNSINYDRNIAVMNSKAIKNRIVYGYTASNSYMEVLDKSRDLPDNFNGADIIEASTDLKFAHLIVLKDIFVKETSLNSPNYGKYIRKDTIECGNDICYLITLKNYGNLDAKNVVVRDLLKTGMDFTGYVPEYSTEETGLVRQGDMYAYSIKEYIPGVNNYVTGINNSEGENYFHGYACASEALTQKARDAGYNHDDNYAILTRNKSIEFRNISVPARTENSILVTETDYKDYDVLKERAVQNNNDKVIGVVEVRMYYTINCRDIGTNTL